MSTDNTNPPDQPMVSQSAVDQTFQDCYSMFEVLTATYDTRIVMLAMLIHAQYLARLVVAAGVYTQEAVDSAFARSAANAKKPLKDDYPHVNPKPVYMDGSGGSIPPVGEMN
jgi:hypothetical protein